MQECGFDFDTLVVAMTNGFVFIIAILGGGGGGVSLTWLDFKKKLS